MKKSAIYIYILIMLLSTNLVIAQNMSDLECGDIRVEELTAENDVHEFDLNVSAGTFLNITIEPIGNSLNPFMTIYDSGLNVILRLNSEPEGQAEQLNDYQISSSTPRIKLFGTRLGYYNYTTEHKGSLGAYTIRIGCTLLNGDVINPGAVAPPTEQPDNIVGDPPPFSGFGFPGLAPVDFSQVAAFPMESGAVMQGGITPTGGEIVGYTIAANAGDLIDLAVIRGGGNLNLGLVVISEHNELVYQASLINTITMQARFTAPSQGTYTIGVYRVDLLPPAEPEATAFQVRVVINPE